MSAVSETLSHLAATAGLTVIPNEKLGQWCEQKDGDVAVFSYASHDHFSWLWGLTAELGGLAGILAKLAKFRQEMELTIVVVWDGAPEGRSDSEILPYVTPYDWALALSLMVYDHPNYKDDASIKLRILILNASSQSGSSNFVARNIFSFHNAIPWIQDYWPIQIGEISEADLSISNSDDARSYAWLRQAVPQGRQDGKRLIDDLRQLDSVLTTFPNEDILRREHLEAVAELWKQRLLKSQSRHSVANWIAPFVLAGELPTNLGDANIRGMALTLVESGSLLRRALREVLTVIGLLPAEPKPRGMRAAGMLSGGRGIFERKFPINVLLMDDQFALGYQHVLAYVLFGSRYNHNHAKIARDGSWSYSLADAGALQSTAGVDALFQAFGKQPIQDWSLPRIFDVPHCDILLLDLRLWMEGQTQRRRRLLAKVVAACGDLGASTLKDPLFNTALRAAQAIADGNSANELEAIALLPLLISFYDPSLPVVLFSSTQQKTILELVQHRPNIITEFSKPSAVTTDGAFGASSALADLEAALSRAVDLHELRLIWRRLPNLRIDRSAAAKIAPDGYADELTDKLSNFNLTGILSALYQKHLLVERFSDFVAAPWELIEWMVEGTRISGGLHKGLAFGLKLCRNGRAHEFVVASLFPDSSNALMRLGAATEFLFLLDYFRAHDKNHTRCNTIHDRMSSFLKNKYKSLNTTEAALLFDPFGNLKPEHPNLFEFAALDITEFICLALASGAQQSGRYLSVEGERALLALVDGVAG